MKTQSSWDAALTSISRDKRGCVGDLRSGYYNRSMKNLPMVLFLVALLVAGGYLYLSHQDKRAHTSAARNQVSATKRIELAHKKESLNKQLSQMRPHSIPGHADQSKALEQQLNAIQSELDQIEAEKSDSAPSSQTTITMQARLAASIIFGLIGLIVIFAKRFPEDQKKYGFGMLGTILAFWLKP